ncbi:MAG: hypothetical protein DHS20C17_36210 [Cyclobacteriaceae bacterium]|nr:MAG: hypothetical protein DHS20C17_36210 [Cyclobacteriaceae bacterium]
MGIGLQLISADQLPHGIGPVMYTPKIIRTGHHILAVAAQAQMTRFPGGGAVFKILPVKWYIMNKGSSCLLYANQPDVDAKGLSEGTEREGPKGAKEDRQD